MRSLLCIPSSLIPSSIPQVFFLHSVGLSECMHLTYNSSSLEPRPSMDAVAANKKLCGRPGFEATIADVQ